MMVTTTSCCLQAYGIANTATAAPLAALLLIGSDASSSGAGPTAAQAAGYHFYLDLWLQRWQGSVGAACPAASQEVCYTQKGLAYTSTGGDTSLLYATNTAFLALAYASYIDGLDSTAREEFGYAEDAARRHRCWARSQMCYVLGSTGSADYSKQCDWTTLNGVGPNPNVAYGGLVAGPDDRDGYEDQRSNQKQTEPKTYFSAGLIGGYR
jgi:hypothetical protein